LISQIQDEAHRYAIDYHRKLRKRNVIASELDTIEGIGERRRINLLKHFKSIDGIRKADIEELAKVEGMNRSVADKVYRYFH
jgi:excinuclease ABC subunit C